MVECPQREDGKFMKEDQLLKGSSCVLVLQRIVAMFIKSKQQIREQLQLKAKKQSSSLRQSLNKVASKKNQTASKIQDQDDELVSAFRKKHGRPISRCYILNQCFCKSSKCFLCA